MEGTIPDYYIEAINPIDSTLCADELTQKQIILGGISTFEADTAVLNGDSDGYAITIPLCVGGNYQSVKYTTGYCWTQSFLPPPPGGGGSTAFFVICSGDISYCVTNCEWCTNVVTGKKEETNCTSSGHFQGECSNPPSGAWVTGDCYDISPCN
jgi:hypothetical protein